MTRKKEQKNNPEKILKNTTQTKNTQIKKIINKLFKKQEEKKIENRLFENKWIWKIRK